VGVRVTGVEDQGRVLRLWHGRRDSLTGRVQISGAYTLDGRAVCGGPARARPARGSGRGRRRAPSPARPPRSAAARLAQRGGRRAPWGKARAAPPSYYAGTSLRTGRES
jgi:hypothetical protein